MRCVALHRSWKCTTASEKEGYSALVDGRDFSLLLAAEHQCFFFFYVRVWVTDAATFVFFLVISFACTRAVSCVAVLQLRTRLRLRLVFGIF
jgi:hypothetical protein